MLADPVQSDPFFLSSITKHPRGPRTLDLAGLPIRAAAAAGLAHGRWSLHVDDAAIDRAVRPGTVSSRPPGQREADAA
jgi:hypothetical protein